MRLCIKKEVMYMDKRIRLTKEKLRDALISLMHVYELKDISVSMLVKKAECTRSTFYNHFDSVQVLLYELIDDTLEEIKRQIRKPYENLDEIDFSIFPKKEVSLFYYLRNHQDLFHVLMKESKTFDLNRYIADTIEELYVEEYNFNLNNPNVDPKLFNIYAANGISAIILRWMETGYKEDPELLADQAIELLKTASLGFSQK